MLTMVILLIPELTYAVDKDKRSSPCISRGTSPRTSMRVSDGFEWHPGGLPIVWNEKVVLELRLILDAGLQGITVCKSQIKYPLLCIRILQRGCEEPRSCDRRSGVCLSYG